MIVGDEDMNSFSYPASINFIGLAEIEIFERKLISTFNTCYPKTLDFPELFWVNSIIYLKVKVWFIDFEKLLTILNCI